MTRFMLYTILFEPKTNYSDKYSMLEKRALYWLGTRKKCIIFVFAVGFWPVFPDIVLRQDELRTQNDYTTPRWIVVMDHPYICCYLTSEIVLCLAKSEGCHE
jgi:hypothetical protein